MPPRLKRRLRFSIRVSMLIVAIAAIPLARIAVRARAQKEAVRAILKVGGFVGYDWEYLPDGKRKPGATAPAASWYRDWLGPDYFDSVQYVNLQRDDVDDDVMVHVGKLYDLRDLSITGTRITDEGIAQLAGLSRLRKVYFQWDTNLTGACLESLKNNREMIFLGIFSNGVRDEHLAAVEGFNALETFWVRSEQVTDAGMVHLQGLTRLKYLTLDNSKVTGRGLEQFRDMKMLEKIHLPPTIDRLTPLRGLTRLREITAWDAPIDDAGLEGIEDLKVLEDLRLGRTMLRRRGDGQTLDPESLNDPDRRRISDVGLARLKGLDRMKTLVLCSLNLTDAGLVHLAGMTRLELLNLDRTSVTDAGLAHLTEMKSLQLLCLRETHVEGKGFVHLVDHPSLYRLFLDSTPLDDAGMATLAKLKSLNAIQLSHTLITDVGLMELAVNPGPFRLDLTGTQVTAKGVAALRKATSLLGVDGLH